MFSQLKSLSNERRIKREFKTIKIMVGIYCRDHHGTHIPCKECHELLNYASVRLNRCPLRHNKPTCNKCPIHCYKPARKEEIKAVMRYAGPRMFFRHPILSLFHFIDERKIVDPP